MKNIEINIIKLIIMINTILVGSPIKYNANIIHILAFIVIAIYFIRSIKTKRKINITRLDISILILVFSSIIPVIANNAQSLSGAINYIFRYLSAFAIYIIIKNEIKSKPEQKDKLINTLLASITILALIGLDNMYSHIFDKILIDLGNVSISNIEHRMFGNFGYANAFAIIMAVGILISITEKENSKIQSSIRVLLTICLVLTYSRLVLILFSIGLILYIYNTRKEKNKILSIIIEIIISLLAVSIIQKQNISILIYTIIGMSIIYDIIIYNLACKINMPKINKKLIIIIGIYIIAVVSILFMIFIRIKEPLLINNQAEYKYKIANIEPNKEYTFSFDIETKSNDEKEIYEIEIIEENKYLDEIKNTSISFVTYQGNKEITIKTEEETVEIALIFKCNKNADIEKYKINECIINGKEYILNYKYLPTNLIHKLKSINLKNKSVSERIVMIKDAMKIIKDNWLCGIGGNGWKYKYQDVQEYSYNAQEIHSYPIQVILEFGIVGAIGLVCIIYSILKLYIKSNNKYEWIPLIILLIHSFMDFDMTFMYVMQIFFVLLAINSSEEENKIENSVLKNIILGIYSFIWIFAIVISISLKDSYLYNLTEVSNTKSYEINTMKTIIKNEPFEVAGKLYTKLLKNELSEENIELVYSKIDDEKININIDSIIEKTEILNDLGKILEDKSEYKNVFYEKLLKEKEENLQKVYKKESRLNSEEKELYAKIFE